MHDMMTMMMMMHTEFRWLQTQSTLHNRPLLLGTAAPTLMYTHPSVSVSCSSIKWSTTNQGTLDIVVHQKQKELYISSEPEGFTKVDNCYVIYDS